MTEHTPTGRFKDLKDLFSDSPKQGYVCPVGYSALELRILDSFIKKGYEGWDGWRPIPPRNGKLRTCSFHAFAYAYGELEAACEKVDIHQMTASLAFGVKPEDVTPEQRAHAKHRNFMFLYGTDPDRMTACVGARTGRTAAMAENFIRLYGLQKPKD